MEGPCDSRVIPFGCYGMFGPHFSPLKRFVFAVREDHLATEILADLRRATDFGAGPWRFGI
jgi:hypothetical protein